MDGAFTARCLLLFGTLIALDGAAAKSSSPVRVLRSTVVDCVADSDASASSSDCLQLAVAWVHGVPKGAKPSVDEILTGPQFIQTVMGRFGAHSPEVFDAIARYLGRWVTKKSKRKPLAKAALDRLFQAGLILTHSLEEDVSLTVTIERRVAALGYSFFRETGKRVVVTSGSRTPESQAKAMHTKHRLGVRLSRFYRSAAAKEIEIAFRAAAQSGADREAIIAAGADVIRQQMARGVYISKHLMHDAVDIRSRDLTRRQKSLFRRLAREHGFRVLLETRPPHFHLSLAKPQA